MLASSAFDARASWPLSSMAKSQIEEKAVMASSRSTLSWVISVRRARASCASVTAS